MTAADLAILLDHPGYRADTLHDHVRFAEWMRSGSPVLPLIPLDEYRDLDPKTRAKYDDRRNWHNFHPPLIPTPLVKSVRAEMDQRMAYNEGVEDGLKHLILDGGGGLGKSSAARDYVPRAYQNCLLRGDATPSVPVVWVKVPAMLGIEPLLKAIGDFVGCPFQARTVGRYGVLIAEFLVTCGTRLLVLDDLHRLNEQRHSKETTINFLKWLSDAAHVGYLVTAVDLRSKGWYQDGYNDSQWWERVIVLDVHRNAGADEDDAAAWKGIIEDLEERLLLMKHRPGTLTKSDEMAKYLHARTQGRIGRLVELLGNAARTSILDGSERITRELLETTTTSGVNHVVSTTPPPPARPTKGARKSAR